MMAITTLDGYIASKKQLVMQKKTTSMTAVAQMYTSPFAIAGIPGAGTLAGTNTANGLVPTHLTAGCPLIAPFTGPKGYISRINCYGSVSGQIILADLLFKAGAYSYNSNVTLSSQPSYASRIPDGGYGGTEIWIEAVTAFTGNLSIAVTYTNGAGVTGRTTGTIATGIAPIIGRCIRLPLQAGDTGVQKIESVVATVATVGTFNVLVVRPLQTVRIPFAGYSEARDLYGTGMMEIFADSALVTFVRPDSTATGLPEWEIEIADG